MEYEHDWKGVFFGVHWHSKGDLHATLPRPLLPRSLLHLGSFLHCDPKILLRLVIFALMWSQVTVAEQWTKKYCIPGFHCCAMGCNNRTSTLIIAKYAIHRKTDEHGEAHKLIFAHSRAWRHLKTFDIIRWNQLRQKKIKAVNKWQANGQKVV
jgi:hypothetical protein